MSGHSRWSGIKHKKAAIDAKKGKTFSKLIKEITVAARDGGKDIDSNARLRSAVEAAKAANMPSENVKKAIQRGTGEIPGLNYEETSYEGYGPGGVAVKVDVLTDNKNRSASEIRNIFSKRGGNLGETGCVGWMFNKKGYISIAKEKVSEDKLLELTLDAGAEDVKSEDEEFYEVITLPSGFEIVKKVLEANKIQIFSSEITLIPSTYVKLEGRHAEQMIALMNDLDEHDDVQNIYANFDISKELLKKAEEQ